MRVSPPGAGYDEQRAAVAARVEEVVALGARVLRTTDAVASDGGGYYYVVLQDPEGNEFCLT